MSEVDFDSEDPLDDSSFSDSDFSDPGGTNPGMSDSGFDEQGFDSGGYADPQYEQGYAEEGAVAPGYEQQAYAPAGPTEKPPLNVYTVMLFISLISLIIGIIALSIQLAKYDVI